MDIGERIKNLRIQKNLTQEELGERTDLTKGYISQLERDLSSPSLETFFALLEVLGTTPEKFFREKDNQQKVVYQVEDVTTFQDEEKGYVVDWLVSDSNENKMEPILLTLKEHGEYKQFEPSLSETFAYVIEGSVCVELGLKRYFAQTGESIYFQATETHQIKNDFHGTSRLLLVATESYL